MRNITIILVGLVCLIAFVCLFVIVADNWQPCNAGQIAESVKIVGDKLVTVCK